MAKKKIHKVYHDRTFNGWLTNCGEVFWPRWKGTTEMENVTCKRCMYCKPKK